MDKINWLELMQKDTKSALHSLGNLMSDNSLRMTHDQFKNFEGISMALHKLSADIQQWIIDEEKTNEKS